MTGTFKIRSAGVPYAKRILDGENIVGMAEQLANGWWILFGPDGQRLNSGKAYSTPKRALTAFCAISSIQGDDHDPA